MTAPKDVSHDKASTISPVAQEEMLVKMWLNSNEINGLHLSYQQSIRDGMLRWTLTDEFRAALEAIDFSKQAFTPDLACCYFNALTHPEKPFEVPACEWFLPLNQAVVIRTIDPMGSLADACFASLDQLFQAGAQFSIPACDSVVVAETAKKIKRALTLLKPIQATGVDSHLLHSISLFAGNQEASTSGTYGVIPGRVYIREVVEPYPDFYYLDMMMHEISHLYFNLIFMFNPLISDYSKHFFSVAKNTDRPILGIYNATFVLYRLIMLYPLVESILRQSECALPPDASYEAYLYQRFFRIPFNYDFRLVLYRMKFQVACEQLLGSGALTSLGRLLLLGMRDEVGCESG